MSSTESTNCHDHESRIVEQGEILNGIRDYVENHSHKDQLHKAEETIFRMLLNYGRSVLQEVIDRHAGGKLEGPVITPEGIPVKYNGDKSRQYLSIFGSLEIQRAYYWSPGVSGFFPLDSKLNLPEHKYSYLLSQWTQSQVANQPYSEVLENMQRMLGLTLYTEGQERIGYQIANDVESFYAEEHTVAPDEEGEVLIATADCKGVPMVPAERSSLPKGESKIRRGRGDKRKGLRRDAVVTSDYSFTPASREAEEVIDGLMAVNGQKASKPQDSSKDKKAKDRQPKNKHILASMESKEVAFKDLADRIARRDPEQKKPIFVLFDGERALEKQFKEEVKTRKWKDRVVGYGLDIVHAMEYLWEAGTALHGERNPEREKWVRKKALDILGGKVGYVIGGLRQIKTKREKELSNSCKLTLEKVARYFDNHRHMMRYDEYLKAGYPIATGVIEGACGCLVKDRTDGSGMKWTKKGVQAVLDIRAVKKNGNWDEFWKYHIKKERNRLYGK